MRKVPPFSLGQFVHGLSLPFRGAAYLITHRGVKRYAALPLLANIVLYAAALAVFYYFLWNWQIAEAAWQFWGPVGGWLAAAVNWMGWMVKLVVAVVALAASFFTFTAVGMVISSPLNDILSEKIENDITGGNAKLDLPFRFTTKAAIVSVYDSICNLVRQLVCTLLVLPLLLVPLAGFVPLMLVGGYFAGFGFLDTALARNYLRPPHKRLIARKRFWSLLGFGITMQALFAVPFVGMLLMPVGVAAGTILYCGEDWDTIFAEAGMEKPIGFVPPTIQRDRRVD